MSTRRAFLCGMAAAAIVGGTVTAVPVFGQSGPPERLGLKGYDPVAYFTLGAATLGVAAYELVWDGVRYRFANARHRDMFRADPDRYAPQFGGQCAMNMANGNRRESDPTIWTISNGRLYVFASGAGSERFRQESEANAARAVTNWQTLKNTPSQ